MSVNSFERIRSLLHCAESRCIYQLDELAVQDQPAREEIERGLRFVDELKQVHYEALNQFVAHPDRFPSRPTSAVLKHSATILSQSLIAMEDIIRKNRSCS